MLSICDPLSTNVGLKQSTELLVMSISYNQQSIKWYQICSLYATNDEIATADWEMYSRIVSVVILRCLHTIYC